MKNKPLSDLNFRSLLKYKEVPPDPRAEKFECSGFCVSCEKRQVAPEVRLEQMSHGAHTEDFSAVIGGPPTPGQSIYRRVISEPVMFLLESPGSSYKNGDLQPCEGVRKRPPVNHYYWSPAPLVDWPEASDLKRRQYGPYFAFLIARFGLGNTYITNAVKCGKTVDGKFSPYNFPKRLETADTKILKNCAENYLNKELEILKPRLVFTFGGKATDAFNLIRRSADTGEGPPIPHARRLLHPAARVSNFFDRNNRLIDEAIRESGLVQGEPEVEA